jgi:hypothetical protein
MIAAKRAAMDKDPAAYSIGVNPEIGDMLSSSDPNVQREGMERMMAFQSQLGIPESKRKLLTAAQTQSLVSAVNDPDPVLGAQALQAIQAKYGEHWPSVFGQLVRDGKMSPMMQVVGAMDGPDDGMPRQNLTSAIRSEKDIKLSLGGDQSIRTKDIDHAVSESLRDFSRTSRMNPRGDAMAGQFEEATRKLAYFYAVRGVDPVTAANRAAQEVIGRYEFGNTFMTPKGQLRATEQIVGQTVLNMKPGDLAVTGRRPNETLTDDQIREQQLGLLQRNPIGSWRNNDGGLQLVYPNGNPVLGADGSPIIMTWQQIRTTKPDPARTITPTTTDPMGTISKGVGFGGVP